MRFTEKKVMALSIRSWCSIVLLIGSYLFIHGLIEYLENEKSALEYIIGAVLCIVTIVISAFPPESN